MGVTLAVLALVAGGVVAAAIYAVSAARRGVAASLIGEIAEILNVIETHDVENGLANAADVVSPLLSPFSPVIYQSQAARIGLLGAHRARLIASFYASMRDLSDELRALAIESSDAGRAARTKFISMEARATFDLGEEALRCLRPLVSHHRVASLSRA